MPTDPRDERISELEAEVAALHEIMAKVALDCARKGDECQRLSETTDHPVHAARRRGKASAYRHAGVLITQALERAR